MQKLVGVDYQGFVYDCDFNQMLKKPLLATSKPTPHLQDLLQLELENSPIAVGDHCYGCTAGRGSSCDGAITTDPSISFIIPVLNDRDALATLLPQLQRYREKGHEVLIVDGGSNDGSVTAAREQVDRIC